MREKTPEETAARKNTSELVKGQSTQLTGEAKVETKID